MGEGDCSEDQHGLEMKTILIFLACIFATKLIEDNLPNLHYKNIIKGFEKYILPYLLMAYLGFLYLQVKIYRDKELEKNYTHTLLIITVVIIAAQALNKHQQKKLTAQV